VVEVVADVAQRTRTVRAATASQILEGGAVVNDDAACDVVVRARAFGQWTGLSRAMLDVTAAERFMAWGGRGLRDPDAQRLMFWDNGDGASGDGRLDWAQIGAGLALAAGALGVQGFVDETAYTPGVVPSTGSITTLGTRTGWSMRIGKMRLAIADVTITTNGTTGYFLVAPVRYTRFRLVSLSGGTPTVNCLIGTI
jgi:hypothetical protein